MTTTRPQLPPAAPAHGETPLRPRQPIARRRRPNVAMRALAVFRFAAILVAPLLATTWLATSPVFALRAIDVRGADRVEREWVRAQLLDLHGRHVLAITLGEVRGRLEHHPWVASISIRKQLPDQMTIELSERQPALLSRRGDTLFFVDARGETIAEWSPDPRREDLPIVIWSGEAPVPTREVQMLLEELAAVRPVWAREVSEIEPLGDGDARLLTAALPWALIVRRGAVAAGVARLEQALPALGERAHHPVVFDVRFERRVVVHPLTFAPTRGT